MFKKHEEDQWRGERQTRGVERLGQDRKLWKEDAEAFAEPRDTSSSIPWAS